jgi:hypothetical protein
MILKPVSILAQDVDSTLRYTTVVTDQEWHEQARAGVARAGVARAGVERAATAATAAAPRGAAAAAATAAGAAAAAAAREEYSPHRIAAPPHLGVVCVVLA